METKLTCQFCSRQFSNNRLLTYHQKNTSYCLELQKKEVNKSKCEFCFKEVTSAGLRIHENNCKIKQIKETVVKEKDEIIATLTEENKKQNEVINSLTHELEEKMNELEEKTNELNELKLLNSNLVGKNEVFEKSHDCVLQLASRPTSTSTQNNIYNSLTVFDEEVFKEKIAENINNNLTKDLVKKGHNGLSQLLGPCIKETNMIGCTDKSRAVFVLKDTHGNVYKDNKAYKIISYIEPITTAKVDEIVNHDLRIRNKMMEINDLKDGIKTRKAETEFWRSHQKGYKVESAEYKDITNRLEKYMQKNQEDTLRIKELEENEDFSCLELENDDIIVAFDGELITGSFICKEIKTDPTKLATKLTNFL